MELDLTKLNKLKEQSTSPYTPLKGREGEGATIIAPDNEKPVESRTELPGGVFSLQREADLNTEQRQRAFEICKKYQDAIKATESLQAEIMKEVNQGGRDYKDLFLKACKIVSLATCNNIFHDHIAREIEQKP